MVYSFGVGFGDINPSTYMDCIFINLAMVCSCVMKALVLAQYASPIIDEEIVNYDIYCRLRNEKLVHPTYFQMDPLSSL